MMETEHAIDWRKSAQEISDDYEAKCKFIESQAAEIEHMKKALEKLACLGNGNTYGNSIGNLIAQKALEASRHDLQATGSHPAPCSKFCEANAFGIEIRNLKEEIANLQALWKIAHQERSEAMLELTKTKALCDQLGAALEVSFAPNGNDYKILNAARAAWRASKCS